MATTNNETLQNYSTYSTSLVRERDTASKAKAAPAITIGELEVGNEGYALPFSCCESIGNGLSGLAPPFGEERPG